MNYLTACWRKTDSIVARKVADEVILVPVRHNVADLTAIYTLNEIAARIWELIDGTRTGNIIYTILVNEFEATPEQVEADLTTYLTQLESIQAIKAVE